MRTLVKKIMKKRKVRLIIISTKEASIILSTLGRMVIFKNQIQRNLAENPITQHCVKPKPKNSLWGFLLARTRVRSPRGGF